jgi:hypothetical protein
LSTFYTSGVWSLLCRAVLFSADLQVTHRAVKIPKRPTIAKLTKERDEVEEELSDTKEELNDLKGELDNARERLSIAGPHMHGMEQEQSKRNGLDSSTAFSVFLLSVAIVWVPRLPDWRTTLGVRAICPSSGWLPSPIDIQTALCDQLQPNDGELGLFAGILWNLAVWTNRRYWKAEPSLAIVGLVIFLCFSWEFGIEITLFLVAVILVAVILVAVILVAVILVAVILVALYFCCKASASKLDRQNGADEVANA